MILIGEMNITYTKGIGEFYCPTCEKEHPCQHKRVRRFLTIYFIPTRSFGSGQRACTVSELP
jgi:hypothetical protein